MKYIVYKDAAGEFRWRTESGGNVTSNNAEGYEKKHWAITQAKKHANGRPVFWDTGQFNKRGARILTRL